MGKKSILQGAMTYVRNVGKHVQRVAAREEGAGEALQEMRRDAKKLARLSHKRSVSADHQRAKALAKKGREAYNNKNYVEAEKHFHDAVLEDGNYALAYLHLGDACYQQSKFNDAIAAWRHCIAVDPKSDAAEKARTKLDRVESGKERTVRELQERIRDGY